MKPAPAAPWTRLVLLGVPVLAAHALLLQPPAPRLAPAAGTQVRFVTRPVPPAVAAPEVPGPTEPLPPQPRSPAARTQPAPAAAGASPPHAYPGVAPAARSTSPAGPDPAAASTAALPTPRPLGMPEPRRLHYEVRGHDGRGQAVTGQALLAWQHDGRSYEARLEVHGAGPRPRVQRSEGDVTASGLAPRYFSDRSRGEQAVHFEREQGRLVFSSNRPPAGLVEGMQDRLSVLLQLAMLVAAQPARFAPGTEVAIPTASTREALESVFVVEAEEDLVLPGGALRALKLHRLPRGAYDQKVELWLAPGMDYAPVRLRLTNPDGGTLDQRWSATDKG